ncbi:MAG: hypothetical protein L0Z62_16045 [Gemmataceae bacterium]|nr:hypothetical protein [Gemmataceae bacterium]
MDVDPKEIAADIPQFLATLERVPWFLNLGKPHHWDKDVVRIHDWDEWHGPQAGYGDWFGGWPAVVREAIEAIEAHRREELQTLWDKVHSIVFECAKRNVPLFDPKRDAWYGPTTCVWDAAYISALVAWHILLNRPIPPMIAGEWRWYSEGHWPCDFAEEPVGIDEALVDFHLKFQVY